MSVNRAGRRRSVPASKRQFKKIPSVNKNDLNIGSESINAENLTDNVMSKIQEHVDMFQYEQAFELCTKAAEMAPEDADIRYRLGTLCLELGDFQNGFENIRTSLHLNPNTTPDRFFAFAQLLPGTDALQVYEHGLKVFEQQQNEQKEQHSQSEADSLDIRRKVSTACCAAAELFMTDLCDEVDAEIQCSYWLDNAMKADSKNPEVYRVKADLKVCQQIPQEARENVLEACKLWREELERLEGISESEDSASTISSSPLEFPSYESRISAAKILIELNESDLWEKCLVLLEQLLKEDDSVLMTWYLLCLTIKLSGSSDSNDLKDAIEGSLRVARRDGFLSYPQMSSEDELVLEILKMAQESDINVDLEQVEEFDEAAALDLEEALKEAEALEQLESSA